MKRGVVRYGDRVNILIIPNLFFLLARTMNEIWVQGSCHLFIP